MDVDRIRTASHRIGEPAGVQNVVGRERVPADDPPGLPNADLRSSCGDARAFETRNALAKELQQLHYLQTRFYFGARQIVGVERIDIRNARHVDRHFIGIRRDEEGYDFSRDIDDAVAAASSHNAYRPATAVSDVAVRLLISNDERI